jgi:hypothetical protein
MKLKLKESIRANGVQYLPPSVVDTDEIGITQADADVLIRRGTAVSAEDTEPAPAADAPEVIAVDQPPAEAEPEPAPAKAARKR